MPMAKTDAGFSAVGGRKRNDVDAKGENCSLALPCAAEGLPLVFKHRTKARRGERKQLAQRLPTTEEEVAPLGLRSPNAHGPDLRYGGPASESRQPVLHERSAPPLIRPACAPAGCFHGGRFRGGAEGSPLGARAKPPARRRELSPRRPWASDWHRKHQTIKHLFSSCRCSDGVTNAERNTRQAACVTA
ncbi:hypothetical protein AAFF_G00310770 [Aldrovandia affinis]|uniref:Uncharacterized protein n=1 Tax=Aldrovandia affinis TaxID=143900 RepID=A0AAD7R7P3_9TELE|nr:hypothetical protein AAFF_G00310770 [Aldrovandia affinis]